MQIPTTNRLGKPQSSVIFIILIIKAVFMYTILAILYGLSEHKTRHAQLHWFISYRIKQTDKY